MAMVVAINNQITTTALPRPPPSTLPPEQKASVNDAGFILATAGISLTCLA